MKLKFIAACKFAGKKYANGDSIEISKEQAREYLSRIRQLLKERKVIVER